MALQDQKITSSDLANKGVVGLPDTPNLSTLVMQQKFDEIATAVIVPKFNDLIDYLAENLAPIVSDNPQDGEVLIYFADSSQYKNGVYRTTLSALKDVNVGGVQNKMFLCYDADRDLWYPEASSGVMETISACKDVSIVNPQTGDILKFDGTAWANVLNEQGLLIVFNIESEDGATITALTPSGNTVTATSLGGGQYVIKSDEYGEWVLTGEKNGETVTTTVSVDTAKIYDVTMNFFAATITATYPADATVTCSKDSEEYTATGSPYTFTVHESGDWVIEGTRSGITETQTVTITTNGQSESVTLTILPDGSTITPTDSIPTLLHCADIWDKSYTSIGEVLDDSTSLFKILTTDNSIDYLVRSTTYASSVTADEDAMAMIGSYDYASDTLLTDSTWATAIVGSVYVKSVSNIYVPKMTSNTAPSGKASASTEYTSSYQAWNAFDENSNTWWASGSGVAAPHYLRYHFPTPKKIILFGYNTGNNNRTNTYKIQASNDNFVSDTHDLTDVLTANRDGNNHYEVISNTDSYSDYQMYIVSQTDAIVTQKFVQFYGRENGGVQTWLRSGGITDKSYTTLAEVLADTTTLSALIASHDAVDYLVTAKGLIDGIVADATAMSYIGLNNYCANTLLADTDWLSAIVSSAYKEAVLNVKVPVMTGYNTPSGLVIYDGEDYGATGRKAWMAFDGNSSTRWMGGAGTYDGYDFGETVTIYACTTVGSSATGASGTFGGIYESSLDNSVWNAFNDEIDFTGTGDRTFETLKAGGVSARYMRFRAMKNTGSPTSGLYCDAMQFYGRKDV